ncbi:hypothetical protein ABR738_19750 [Streptomyces sp. Edi4]|uniref:hypothetical protein n=1 Tax=Streptomyces sp. Edi4 TaxID=3162527 RepID=UPI0033059E3B
MVGLFWITADEVYLGTPPGNGDTGVLLTPDGAHLTGPEPRDWPWPDLLDLRVEDVPVRSAPVRWTIHAVTVAAAVFDLWSPSDPALMSVALTTKGQDQATVGVYSGAAIAYSQRETDLSLGLLARFVRGESSPSVLTRWWNETPPDHLLRSREREAVLEGWLGLE